MATGDKMPTLAGLKAAFDWLKARCGVTGVKGDAEANYRTGNVNITPTNLGIISGTHVQYFTNGSATIPFSVFGLNSRPSAIVLTPNSTNCFIRYDWDSSTSDIVLACVFFDYTPATGNVRFSYIVIP